VSVFRRLDGHEQVVFGHDAASGLRCIIAIHSTQLGPALGGTRMYPYASEEDALEDVLRLSEGMTYKAACAGLDLGGGKAVIIGDPATDKSEALLRAYGRIVESLNGRYVTACDVGTSPADLALVGRETRWATGGPLVEGGSGDSGIMTAWGVYLGVRATAKAVFGTPDLTDRHVSVLGLGKVGGRLAQHVLDNGGRVTVADINAAAVAAFAGQDRVSVVSVDELPYVEADILSPNALGGLLTDELVSQLRVQAICGGANNQLATDEVGERLHAAGIVYAPDFVVNAGGLISVSDELHPDGFSEQRVKHRANQIDDTLQEIFAEATEAQVPTGAAAITVARRRMARVGGLRGMWLPAR
jgi:valine dehydrogenase (NAD+)